MATWGVPRPRGSWQTPAPPAFPSVTHISSFPCTPRRVGPGSPRTRQDRGGRYGRLLWQGTCTPLGEDERRLLRSGLSESRLWGWWENAFWGLVARSTRSAPTTK